MYNYWHVCAKNWRKEYVASNQVVGGSNPSGRTIISMTYDAPENCTVQFKYEFYVDNQRALLLLHISQLIVTPPPKFNSNLY